MKKQCRIIAAHKRKGKPVKQHVRCTSVKNTPKQTKEKSSSKTFSNYDDATSQFDSFMDGKDDAIASINEYTDGNYSEINSSLRRSGKLDSGNDATVKGIDEVFKSNPPVFEGTTHRAIGFTDENKFKSFVSSLEGGDTFVDKGYMSSSNNKRITEDFEHTFSVRFEINSKKGISIKNFSNFPKEEEILFNRGSKFNINSVEKDGTNGYKVSLSD